MIVSHDPPPALPQESVQFLNPVQRLALRRVLDSPEWGRIVGYWNLLNRVPGSGGAFEPAGELDPAKADSMVAEIRRCVEALNPSGKTDGLWRAVSTTALLVETRALRLSRLNPVFLTRMVPAWTKTMEENALYDLDARLRALERLRSAGEVPDQVFESATDTLFMRFETWALLQGLSDVYHMNGSHYFPGDTIMEIQLLYGILESGPGGERLRAFQEMRPYLEPLFSRLLPE